MKRNKYGFIVIFFAILGFIWLTWLSPQPSPTQDPLSTSSSSEAESTSPVIVNQEEAENDLDEPDASTPSEPLVNDFDEHDAFTLLETLANDYEGRMAGTKKNNEAANFIGAEFEAIGLQAPSGGYLQPFEAMVPVFGDTFILEVKDSQGLLIKSYRLRKDFGFGTPYYAGGGDIESTFREIRRASDAENDLIVLHPEGVRRPQQQLDLLGRGIQAVIAPASSLRGDEFEYLIKGASILNPANKRGDMLILAYVTPAVYDELIDFSKEGYRLHIVNDLEFETVTLNNVIGILPGTDSSLPPLVIGGHFDHVGSDPDGVIFPGALDNASGTTMTVQLAKSMARKEEKPKRTLVFVAFNGEEVGLLGAVNFLENPPISSPYEVINFDMVGTDPSYPLSMDGIAQESELLEKLLSSAKNWDIPTDASTTGKYASDHLPFLQSGFNAFTLIQLDMQRLHTPDDDPSDINLEQFDKIGEMMEDFLTIYAYEQ